MPDTQRRSPYQGLDPFDEKDADFFFGREKETRLIIANLFASPLTILYGASGVGKSSVLRAGVAYQLHQRDDILVVVFGTWQGDPVKDLKAAIAKEASRAVTEIEPPSDSLSLAEYLSAWAQKLNRRIMLILDQFEEYFLYHPQDDAFANEFPKAVTRRDIPISFLIAIREDSIAKLDQFKGRIPGLFDNYLRLGHLDYEAAIDAIIKPVEQYNRLLAKPGQQIGINPKLAQGVVKQLQNEHQEVETPYLQLVMTRLWDAERRAGSYALRLETLNRLGDVRHLVQTHLDEVLNKLSAADQDVVARVFQYLAPPSGMKVAYTVQDLVDHAKTRETDTARILERFSSSDRRILRPVEPPLHQPQVRRYEIFHDVLIPAVRDWRSRFLQSQRARTVRRWRLIGLSGVALAVIILILSVIYNISRPTPACDGSGWTILLLRPVETLLQEPKDWKSIRIDFALANSGPNFRSPCIPVAEVRLNAKSGDQPVIMSYQARTFVTTGLYSNPTDFVIFRAKIPNKFQVMGEYQPDGLVTYYFESIIPKSATPIYFDIRNYGTVPYNIINWTSTFSETPGFLQPDTQVSAGRLFLSVSNFKRDSTWHPVHDLITADISIISANPDESIQVNLEYVPLSERGILGAPVINIPSCKPSLTVGPSMVKKSQICVIVPKGEKNIKLIFTGDVNTVYDTGL